MSDSEIQTQSTVCAIYFWLICTPSAPHAQLSKLGPPLLPQGLRAKERFGFLPPVDKVKGVRWQDRPFAIHIHVTAAQRPDVEFSTIARCVH